MYSHYQAGFLPISGGFLNQPNAFLEAMQLIQIEAKRT